jgi:hypothetical protein
MTGNVWLCVWITVSLMTSVVIGQGERTQDRDMSHAQIEIVIFPPASGDDTDAVAEFQRRLRQYDAVRGRLDASLPVQAVSSNPAEILAIIEAHHSALRSARQTARQGDMFSPSIAGLFRHWILDSLRGMTADEFLLMITEDDAPPMAPPSVNASYPDGGALTTMPPQLLQILPTLPSGLEYRFIDRDLILWDRHANLIIDFIPHALSLWDES